MNRSLKRIILILTFLTVLIADVITTVSVSKNLLDDDTSGEMLLSKCLYDEKSLICSDWIYATEVRVANQLVFAPLFGIFSDWASVRITGTMIIQAILLLSLIFMLKAGGLHTDSILLGMTQLLLPYCVAYGRISLYHCYYSLYISAAFFITGLCFQVLDEKHTAVPTVILLFLCMIVSLNGLRMVFICILPLCILFFRIFLRTKEKRIFLTAFFCGTASLAGLLLYAFAISKLFRLETSRGINLSFKGFSEVYVVIFSILRQFGYRSGIAHNSLLWLMSLLGIGIAIYAVSLSGKAFFFGRSQKKQLLKAVLFVQLALTSATFLFYQLPYNSRYDYSRYLVPASVWIIPLLCAEYEEMKTTFPKLCFYAVMIVFSVNSIMNLCFFQNPGHFSQEYDGLSYTSTESISRFENAAAFITNEGYEKGYAFIDNNSLSEYMDGFPIIGITYRDGKLSYLDWLTRKSLRSSPADRVFLIAGRDDAATFLGVTGPENSELVYNENDLLFIYRLTDPESFRSDLDNE